jgi:adenylate cyclase
VSKKPLLIISFGVAALWAGLSFVPRIQTYDRQALEVFRTTHKPHPDLIIMAIDNKSLSSIGRWPWDRSVHARFLQRVGEGQPRVVAFDINFSETQDMANDQELRQALGNAVHPVVLASEAVYFNNSPQPSRFIKPLDYFYERSHISIGHVNVEPRSDGVADESPTTLASPTEQLLPFAYAVNNALGARERAPAARFLIDFAGQAGAIPTYSYSDVLDGKVSPELWRDKVILIGATASDLHDVVLTPVGHMAGIEWHANVLDNLLTGRGKTLPATPYRMAIMILLGVILVTIFIFTNSKQALLALLVALGVLSLGSFIVWQTGIAVPYLFGGLLFILLYLGNAGYRWYKTEAEKRRLRRTTELYFSPQVLEYVLAYPESLKLGGERKEVTIFFSDIRSFTTITETASPEVLSVLLHEYFTEMTEEIFATDGVVDKFIGDAIMAFWGAPLRQDDQADRALTAALGMISKLEQLRESWKAKGWPEVRIGIGIATGIATVGNMGSDKRFDYTVIGDSVNIAARLESATKDYNVPIIVSESTKEKTTREYNFIHLGSITVKGKTQAINAYGLK